MKETLEFLIKDYLEKEGYEVRLVSINSGEEWTFKPQIDFFGNLQVRAKKYH